MMSPECSVIICTHDPRTDYLTRVLEALRLQTLPKDRWELVVLDNASDPPVQERMQIEWHPNLRWIYEAEPGLTRARYRAIEETNSSLLVFVDDDNVLDPNYLQEACRIGEKWPQLGAWGGWCDPEFEVEPAPWITPYRELLAVYAIDREYWSNQGDAMSTPCGAGLCIRRRVVEIWTESLDRNPVFFLLGRNELLRFKGKPVLLSGEDSHLVNLSHELGLGCGKFPQLHFLHLIPRSRLTAEYIREIAFGMVISRGLLRRLRGEPDIPRNLLCLAKAWLNSMRFPKERRSIEQAKLAALFHQARILRDLGQVAKPLS